jgi:hypothetical protein
MSMRLTSITGFKKKGESHKTVFMLLVAVDIVRIALLFVHIMLHIRFIQTKFTTKRRSNNIFKSNLRSIFFAYFLLLHFFYIQDMIYLAKFKLDMTSFNGREQQKGLWSIITIISWKVERAADVRLLLSHL